MNFGRLRCLGTQTRLKARFGTGYQLQFQCAFGKVVEVESFIRMHLPQATHLETYAGAESVSCPDPVRYPDRGSGHETSAE